MSLSTMAKRIFFSQVINTAFSLFLLPALHLKITNQSPYQSPQQAIKRTPAPQEIQCSLFLNEIFGILQNSSFIYIETRTNTHTSSLDTANNSSSSCSYIPQYTHVTLHWVNRTEANLLRNTTTYPSRNSVLSQTNTGPFKHEYICNSSCGITQTMSLHSCWSAGGISKIIR